MVRRLVESGATLVLTDIRAADQAEVMLHEWKIPSSSYFYFAADITDSRQVDRVVNTAFDKFPNLKIIVSHGGGAVPYQVGRYRAFFGRHFEASGGFDAQLKKSEWLACDAPLLLLGGQRTDGSNRRLPLNRKARRNPKFNRRRSYPSPSKSRPW